MAKLEHAHDAADLLAERLRAERDGEVTVVRKDISAWVELKTADGYIRWRFSPHPTTTELFVVATDGARHYRGHVDGERAAQVQAALDLYGAEEHQLQVPNVED